MVYFYLKIVHIIVAALLFGVGIGSALYALYTRYYGENNEHKQAVILCWRLSWFVIIPFGIIQSLLGFSIISVRGYSAHTLWVWVTYLGFFVAAILWLISLFCLMQYKDSILALTNAATPSARPCDKSFYSWLIFGFLTVMTIFVMLFFMANRVG